MNSRSSGAFTLIEMLVVVGLIAVLASFLFSGLAGVGHAAALQSGQAILANLVSAARSKAPATGRKVRLLLNADPAVPARYLRYLVLQLARQPGGSPADWDTLTVVSLPEGVYVMPSSLDNATGLVDSSTAWKRTTDPAADLVSDVFANQSLTTLLPGDAAAQVWTGVAFTSNGTLAALDSGPPPKGSLVLAPGIRRPPVAVKAGESPVQLINPAAVRGLSLSVYGVPALLNERGAF